MGERAGVRSFYRIAKTFPPGDGEYRTMFDKKGPPAPDVAEAVHQAWHGLSAFDTEEGARQQAVKRRGKLGSLIVRYDVPATAGINWEKTFGPGHYSLFGDLANLKRYLSDRVVAV